MADLLEIFLTDSAFLTPAALPLMPKTDAWLPKRDFFATSLLAEILLALLLVPEA